MQCCKTHCPPGCMPLPNQSPLTFIRVQLPAVWMAQAHEKQRQWHSNAYDRPRMTHERILSEPTKPPHCSWVSTAKQPAHHRTEWCGRHGTKDRRLLYIWHRDGWHSRGQLWYQPPPKDASVLNGAPGTSAGSSSTVYRGITSCIAVCVPCCRPNMWSRGMVRLVRLREKPQDPCTDEGGHTHWLVQWVGMLALRGNGLQMA
mmetsp:Transcript_147350/g.257535  ORF Transcript_147350/g.257535 Transcript_147350/m.257535 type:complete len:202 (+) Transcript_147350:1498-2103(+)